MNQLPMLIKREFWEHKTTFFYLPAIVTGIALAILIVAAIGIKTGAINVVVNSESSWESRDGSHVEISRDNSTSMMEILGPQLEQFALMPLSYREGVLENLYLGSSFILLSVLWFVIFFYLLGCLYEDRKDRSILFWKSMPVSDWLTVVSKLISGLFLVPMIYLVFIAIGHTALLLISSLLAIGQPVDIWDTLWAPANIVSRWLAIGGYLVFTAFWCLPLYGWLLAVSSSCKSAPFAWVVGVPVLVVILEWVFTHSDSVKSFIGRHTFEDSIGNFDLSRALDMVMSINMLVAIIVGIGFVMVAIWQRGRADEI